MRSITVSARLIEINKALQTLYVDGGNMSAFSYDLKNVLKNLSEFIDTIEPILSEINKYKIAQAKEHMNTILDTHLKKEYDSLPYWEANKFLSWAKKDVSSLCFDIAQICGHYPHNIFNKVIEVE